MATSSTTAISRNEAASTSSATESPNAAISPPASAAPKTEEAAKPRFISALPSLSRSFGCSTTATAPRVSPRPVIASVPSISAEHEHEREEEAVAVGEERERGEDERLDHVERRERPPQRRSRSRCAVRPVANSAGRNFATRKNPAVGATAPCGRRRGSASATTPIESPRSLTVYEPSRRPNGRTRRGSRRLRTVGDSSSKTPDRGVRFAASSARIQIATRRADYGECVDATHGHRRSSSPLILVAARRRRRADEPRRGLAAAVAARPAVRARGRQRDARASRSGPAALGLVPRARAGDGAARAGARPSRSALACTLIDARLQPRARSTGCWPTSPRSRRSRSSAASRSTSLAGDFDPRYGRRAVVRRRRPRRFMATNTLNFADGRGGARYRLRRAACATCCGPFVTALPSEFATGLLTAGVAFTLRPPRHGVGRARRRRALRLPLHPAHERPGRRSAARSSRSARASWPRCRSACSRRCCRRSRCATR